MPGPALAASGGNPARTKVIVTFSRSSRSRQARGSTAGGDVGFTYHVINGFSATMPAAALDALRHNKHVKTVERDAKLDPRHPHR